MISFYNYVQQSCPLFKMVTVTKNRNFFNLPVSLQVKCAQIYSEAARQWVVSKYKASWDLWFICYIYIRFVFNTDQRND